MNASAADAGSLPIPDYANGVAVDPSGDAVVVGLHLRRPGSTSAGCDFSATRLARDGGMAAWRTELPDCESDEVYESSKGERVFIDPGGDVVVTKRATRSTVALKLSGATGAVLWNQHVGGHPKHGPFVHASALDADGDVIVGSGFGRYAFAYTDMVVAKLDGHDGAERWRRKFRGGFRASYEDDAYNVVKAIATDASGDVLVNGVLVKRGRRATPRQRWTIVKLAGRDGAIRWKRDVGETFSGEGGVYPLLAVDARGDVVAGATTPRGRRTTEVWSLTVIKLAGGNGRERWRHRLSYPTSGPAMLAMTADGDVVVTGRLQYSSEIPTFVVVLLDGTTGRERWHRAAIGGSAREWPAGSFPRFNAPVALAVDGASGRVLDGAGGRIFLGAELVNAKTGVDLAVIAIDTATGSERWRRLIDGGTHGHDGARALALAGGNLLVVGEIENPGTGIDALAVALDPSSGEERWRHVYSSEDVGVDRAPAVARSR